MNFPPSRGAGLSRLEAFIPHAASYAATRNFEHGGVSLLSPYIRTRLVTEEEFARAVIANHGLKAAVKLLEEIAWRTYWKGWLEMRPTVWSHYQEALGILERTDQYHTAVSGKTGVSCFDHWIHELTKTGYLHNHARLWFASIWIFTLKLPWQLGAHLFLNHLLDADPAANTLSWRWVAGLHTAGKHYIARAENIVKFTEGRFDPTGQLDEQAPPIPQDRTYTKQPLTLAANSLQTGRIGHLMFPDDLAAPPLELGKIHTTAGFLPSTLETTPLVAHFLDGALTDTLHHNRGARLHGDFHESVANWAHKENLTTILMARPTIGLLRDLLTAQKPSHPIATFIRPWDRQLWPHATSGFFKFRKILPEFFKQFEPTSIRT